MHRPRPQVLSASSSAGPPHSARITALGKKQLCHCHQMAYNHSGPQLCLTSHHATVISNGARTHPCLTPILTERGWTLLPPSSAVISRTQDNGPVMFAGIPQSLELPQCLMMHRDKHVDDEADRIMGRQHTLPNLMSTFHQHTKEYNTGDCWLALCVCVCVCVCV